MNKSFKLNDKALRQIVAMSVNHGWAMRDMRDPSPTPRIFPPEELEQGVIEVMSAIANSVPKRPLLFTPDGNVAATEH